MTLTQRTRDQLVAGLAAVCLLAGSLIISAPIAEADTNCPAASGSLAGDGTSRSPYLVQSQSDLQLVKSSIPSLSAAYLQTADIDMQMSGTNCTWDDGIGYNFSGTYDGGGFEISGLEISASQFNLGLFRYVTGTVKNLGFAGSVTNTYTSDTGDGGLVGYLAGGTVENSYALGDISSASGSSYSGAGGLVGVTSNAATITGSYASGTVSSPVRAGGLVGYTQVSGAGPTRIVESYATGDVETPNTSGSAGGLVANLLNAEVLRSYSTGNVSGLGSEAQHLGGLAAAIGSSSVTDSFATGGVTGWTDSGSVYGQVGGLIGDGTGGSNSVTRSFSVTLAGMSPASGTAFARVGGVAGIVATTTWSSVAWNSQTAPLVLNPVGSTASVSGVSSFTTSELNSISTYVDAAPTGLDWNSGGSTTIAQGYDAAYTWGICPAVNSGYPFLTAFYSSDPCSSSPSPSSTGSVVPTTFRYFLPDGTECTAISPEVVVNHTRVLIPGDDANCRTRGASLSGWSIPHQDWAFTPGYSVYVVASQRFTAILNESTATIVLDANVDSTDQCLASVDDVMTDMAIDSRTESLYLDRPDMSWYAPGDRPSLEVYPAPAIAPCAPPGYELTGWNTRGDGRGTAVAIGEAFGPAINEDDPNSDRNTVRFYAMWERIAS